MFYIYLYLNSKNIPIYVGKGSGQNCKRAYDIAAHNDLIQFITANEELQIEIVATRLTQNEADHLEAILINQLKPLANKNHGSLRKDSSQLPSKNNLKNLKFQIKNVTHPIFKCNEHTLIITKNNTCYIYSQHIFHNRTDLYQQVYDFIELYHIQYTKSDLIIQSLTLEIPFETPKYVEDIVCYMYSIYNIELKSLHFKSTSWDLKITRKKIIVHLKRVAFHQVKLFCNIWSSLKIDYLFSCPYLHELNYFDQAEEVDNWFQGGELSENTKNNLKQQGLNVDLGYAFHDTLWKLRSEYRRNETEDFEHVEIKKTQLYLRELKKTFQNLKL